MSEDKLSDKLDVVDMDQVDLFYRRSSWPVGTIVRHPDNSDLLGNIVKRGGRIWVNRDVLPMVRWHGSIDAVPVEWEQLNRA